eukprot:CAMPEP_0180443284 /NCGR_PEP_ID=MMETSP1036_2-20121128/14589_1 /TAXON_ID=632150 /ORGANISM="Azadinium spinosum, Strain 3D9" /LENGTH=109 /DNA_ID=CAMNT_0022449579 /DNA_START=250 /DNA_END=580 /DNA_ORIENTATION=-
MLEASSPTTGIQEDASEVATGNKLCNMNKCMHREACAVSSPLLMMSVMKEKRLMLFATFMTLDVSKPSNHLARLPHRAASTSNQEVCGDIATPLTLEKLVRRNHAIKAL